eukprot:3543992-Prymnesium_polylepis.1
MGRAAPTPPRAIRACCRPRPASAHPHAATNHRVQPRLAAVTATALSRTPTPLGAAPTALSPSLRPPRQLRA